MRITGVGVHLQKLTYDTYIEVIRLNSSNLIMFKYSFLQGCTFNIHATTLNSMYFDFQFFVIRKKFNNTSGMGKILGMFAEIQEKLEEMNEKLEKNAEEVKLLREENYHLKQIVIKQSERIEMLRKEFKKRNLVVQGVEDEDKYAKNLNGTEIWISDDFTRKMKAGKKLVSYLKEARQKGEKAFIKYYKLMVNGKEMCFEYLTKLKQEYTNSVKRTISDRTPEKHDLEKQLKKISRTAKKTE
ncbi:hypothetical protein FQA39_LY11617 [Lamprigera yunnana]|nr:hypothetical protein FQA39_LY11617 [Lamprigera yunnana]